MSVHEATGAPSSTDNTSTNLPAVRPVIIDADPVEVRTRRPRWRTVTSSIPIVGGITPAPEGMSWPDRALRRVLVEVVRAGLWTAGVVVLIVVNTGLAARWLAGRVVRWPRRRRRAISGELGRLGWVCGECGVVAAREGNRRTPPPGWFHQVTRDRLLCPRCTQRLVDEVRRSWGDQG